MYTYKNCSTNPILRAKVHIMRNVGWISLMKILFIRAISIQQRKKSAYTYKNCSTNPISGSKVHIMKDVSGLVYENLIHEAFSIQQRKKSAYTYKNCSTNLISGAKSA